MNTGNLILTRTWPLCFCYYNEVFTLFVKFIKLVPSIDVCREANPIFTCNHEGFHGIVYIIVSNIINLF